MRNKCCFNFWATLVSLHLETLTISQPLGASEMLNICLISELNNN
jgi:hypothetical protein